MAQYIEFSSQSATESQPLMPTDNHLGQERGLRRIETQELEEEKTRFLDQDQKPRDLADEGVAVASTKSSGNQRPDEKKMSIGQLGACALIGFLFIGMVIRYSLLEDATKLESNKAAENPNVSESSTFLQMDGADYDWTPQQIRALEERQRQRHLQPNYQVPSAWYDSELKRQTMRIESLTKENEHLQQANVELRRDIDVLRSQKGEGLEDEGDKRSTTEAGEQDSVVSAMIHDQGYNPTCWSYAITSTLMKIKQFHKLRNVWDKIKHKNHRDFYETVRKSLLECHKDMQKEEVPEFASGTHGKALLEKMFTFNIKHHVNIAPECDQFLPELKNCFRAIEEFHPNYPHREAANLLPEVSIKFVDKKLHYQYVDTSNPKPCAMYASIKLSDFKRDVPRETVRSLFGTQSDSVVAQEGFPNPNPDDKSPCRHAVSIIGKKTVGSVQYLIFKNSYGDWGIHTTHYILNMDKLTQQFDICFNFMKTCDPDANIDEDITAAEICPNFNFDTYEALINRRVTLIEEEYAKSGEHELVDKLRQVVRRIEDFISSRYTFLIAQIDNLDKLMTHVETRIALVQSQQTVSTGAASDHQFLCKSDSESEGRGNKVQPETSSSLKIPHDDDHDMKQSKDTESEIVAPSIQPDAANSDSKAFKFAADTLDIERQLDKLEDDMKKAEQVDDLHQIHWKLQQLVYRIKVIGENISKENKGLYSQCKEIFNRALGAVWL